MADESWGSALEIFKDGRFSEAVATAAQQPLDQPRAEAVCHRAGHDVPRQLNN